MCKKNKQRISKKQQTKKNNKLHSMNRNRFSNSECGGADYIMRE